MGKAVSPRFGQMVRKILDFLNFVLGWIAFTLRFIQISSLYQKTSAGLKARNWYQRWLWRNGTRIFVWNIPFEKTEAVSIQPKSKTSGLNFRQLPVANGTAFSKISKKRGPFHSTKTFGNLETTANGTKISRESFKEFRKLLNFRNANLSTENSRNPGRSKVERKENFRKKVSENLVIPREVVLFLEILENAPPFATGSCRKFKLDVLVEWKAPEDNLARNTQIFGNFFRKFSFHSTLLPKFLEYSFEWFALRKFNSFRNFWKIFREISVPFAAVSKFSRVLVEWKAPQDYLDRCPADPGNSPRERPKKSCSIYLPTGFSGNFLQMVNNLRVWRYSRVISPN